MLRDHHILFQPDAELSPPRSPVHARATGSDFGDSPIARLPQSPEDTARWLMGIINGGFAPEAHQALTARREMDADVCLILEFSLIDLMNRNIGHACSLVNQTGIRDRTRSSSSQNSNSKFSADSVRRAMMYLVHQEDIIESDRSRLWFRFLDSPSPPSPSIDSIRHAALMAHNLNVDSSTPHQECIVSFDGIILGATTIWRQIYRKTYVCSSCGVQIDILEGESYEPHQSCCRSPMLTEDLSKRILVPCQDLLVGDLVGDLSSLDPRKSTSGVTVDSILVSLIDDLVSLGEYS